MPRLLESALSPIAASSAQCPPNPSTPPPPPPPSLVQAGPLERISDPCIISLRFHRGLGRRRAQSTASPLKRIARLLPVFAHIALGSGGGGGALRGRRACRPSARRLPPNRQCAPPRRRCKTTARRLAQMQCSGRVRQNPSGPGGGLGVGRCEGGV